VAEPFEYPLTVRYLEVDQQGVVFNAWYLAYFDDAMTAFFEHRGLPYRALLDSGHDAQVVHTELDWTGGLGFGDDAVVAVDCPSTGTTSFTLTFDVHRRGDPTPIVRGRTVYVCVATDGTGKRPLPPDLRTALEPGGA
jgi:acyl-CoA thioester hydrolase